MTDLRPRKFLVVIDKTPECAVALRFATRRAQHTGGRVTLMCAATPPDFQQWRGVEEIMRDEAHAEAEGLAVHGRQDGERPGRHHSRTGDPLWPGDRMPAALLKADRDISILVLAPAPPRKAPAPWSPCSPAAFSPIPVTIVPGHFTDAQVDALA